MSVLIVEPKKIEEEKRTTKNEIAEWHHGLDGHELEQAPGVSDGQGSLAQRVRHTSIRTRKKKTIIPQRPRELYVLYYVMPCG